MIDLLHSFFHLSSSFVSTSKHQSSPVPDLVNVSVSTIPSLAKLWRQSHHRWTPLKGPNSPQTPLRLPLIDRATVFVVGEFLLWEFLFPVLLILKHFGSLTPRISRSKLPSSDPPAVHNLTHCLPTPVPCLLDIFISPPRWIFAPLVVCRFGACPHFCCTRIHRASTAPLELSKSFSSERLVRYRRLLCCTAYKNLDLVEFRSKINTTVST